MDTNTLQELIVNQQEIIKNIQIVPRQYAFAKNSNYILVGMRRAGKSTLLYKLAQDLVAQGANWSQIIYLNFEDERLIDFTVDDFQQIVLVAHQLTDKTPYYFFDEIQNIAGWERFARRMADQQQHVYITGSNSQMLGQEFILRLGGRYLTKYVSPFNFAEYLTALQIPHEKRDLLIAQVRGRVNAAQERYLTYGGLPETVHNPDARNFLTTVYQNTYLGDIIIRHQVRNPQALRLLLSKVAETVMHEVSYSSLYKAVKAAGASISRNTVQDYLDFAEESYLLFKVKNFVYKFADRESKPRFYFLDNGILNLLLFDKKSALLENAVAVALHNYYQNDLYTFKSDKNKLDLDFYLPTAKTAVQVAVRLDDYSREREIGALIKFAQKSQEPHRLIIVTEYQKETIKQDGQTIEVMPLADFLLEVAGLGEANYVPDVFG